MPLPFPPINHSNTVTRTLLAASLVLATAAAVHAAGFASPAIAHSVAPAIPHAEYRDRETIRFLVRADLDTAGRVLRAEVVSSEEPELDGRVAAALSQWRSLPATKDGVPQAVTVQFPLVVRFSGTPEQMLLARAGPR